MTTPPRTMSALGISTVLALGVVLLIGACEVPIPRLQRAESQEAEEKPDVDTSPRDVLRITLARDGSLLVNGVPTLMEDVSAVVAPLIADDGRAPVISIGGDREVPYRSVDELQEELMAAGVRRVVFEASVAPLPLTVPPDASALEEQGLSLVLPNKGEEVPVSRRNLLHLIVQPSGIVEVRLGESQRVRQLRPADIEGLWREEVAANPQLIAAVKTHPDADYRLMVEVLDALRSARAARISLQRLEN